MLRHGAEMECLRDALSKAGDGEWLPHDGVKRGAVAAGILRSLRRAAHQDHRELRVALLDLQREVWPSHAWHRAIHQNDVPRRGTHALPGADPIGGGLDGVAVARQEKPEDFADAGLVVHGENS